MIKLTPEKPPYYEIVNNITQKTISVIDTKYTQTATTDTSLTTVHTFELPANTLNENGKGIQMLFWGNSYNASVLYDIYANTFGHDQNFAFTGIKDWMFRLTIIRATESIYYYLMEISPDGNALQGSKGSIDFTIATNLIVKIQAPTSGNIRCSAGIISLI